MLRISLSPPGTRKLDKMMSLSHLTMDCTGLLPPRSRNEMSGPRSCLILTGGSFQPTVPRRVQTPAVLGLPVEDTETRVWWLEFVGRISARTELLEVGVRSSPKALQTHPLSLCWVQSRWVESTRLGAGSQAIPGP